MTRQTNKLHLQHKRFTYCFVATLSILAFLAPTHAQDKRASPAELKALDVKAEKAQQEFLRSLVDLATDYEKAGEIERSKEMLKSILKLKPDTDAVKAKLKAYEEEVFDRKSTIIDLDVSKGWINAGVLVEKDQPVRIQADGEYRFMVNVELGPKGYEQRDPTKDLVAGIPTGALIGMIAPVTRQRNPPKPKPFMIGDAKEVKPTESGILFLRVNVPPQAKCTGKMKVKLSGNIARP